MIAFIRCSMIRCVNPTLFFTYFAKKYVTFALPFFAYSSIVFFSTTWSFINSLPSKRDLRCLKAKYTDNRHRQHTVGNDLATQSFAHILKKTTKEILKSECGFRKQGPWTHGNPSAISAKLSSFTHGLDALKPWCSRSFLSPIRW